MRNFKLTIEQICYLAAFLAAAVVRLLFLAQAALPDNEALFALQSLHLAQGVPVVLGPHPGYVLPTALLMFLSGANNWTARLVPALFGILLVALPYILRERLGRTAAVTLAFFLALDPGLAAVSRQAGGQMLALAALLLAIACFVERKAVWAGIFAGFALLGGPSIWPNMAALAGAGLIASMNREKGSPALKDQLAAHTDLRGMGLAALAILVLAGTCFFIFPASLSAGLASLPAYLQGWVQAGATPLPRMLAGLAAYEAFGLALGLAGMWRGIFHGSRFERFLVIWWVLALLLTLLYPARQVNDLAWTLLPMLALAARWLAPLMNIDEDRKAIYGQGGLILLLLIMIVNLVVSWPVTDPNSSDQLFRYLVLGIALLLIVAETFLVVWGWSRRIGFYGLALGCSAALFLLSLSSLGNAVGISGRPPAEMWQSGPAFTQADLLSKTLRDYSGWRPDSHKTPEVVLLDLTSPALEWLLRDYPGLRVEKEVPVSIKPEFLISLNTTTLDQAAAYTGTSFDLARSPNWGLIKPSDWVNWLVYRAVQKESWTSQSVVLWVRSDLFPGANSKVPNQ